jgi:hypothetical protein
MSPIGSGLIGGADLSAISMIVPVASVSSMVSGHALNGSLATRLHRSYSLPVLSVNHRQLELSAG